MFEQMTIRMKNVSKLWIVLPISTQKAYTVLELLSRLDPQVRGARLDLFLILEEAFNSITQKLFSM